LFNALEVAGELNSTRVLDLYAGSGALGLEALSRGAAEAFFVESDRRAVAILRANVALLGLGGVVRAGMVENVVAGNPPAPFGLVLLDPPYSVTAAQLAQVLRSLDTGGWLLAESLIVIERASRDGDPDWPEGFVPERTKRYGDTSLYWAAYLGNPGRNSQERGSAESAEAKRDPALREVPEDGI
jgi:16S rRNA (guanine966-N2)-methyltransferase